MNRLKEIGLIAALLAISAGPRVPGIGRFTSLDEPFWLRQSANFYYALGQRDFENTIYEYHPAVTTMWIITAGMLLYFPEYRALGQGYLKPGKFDLFLPAHGRDPLQLLATSRLVQVAVVLVLILTVYLLLRLLYGRGRAFFATAFISASPFLIGQSRLLNHEAMLGLFSLISLLAMFVYLRQRPGLAVLLVSAAAAALAQLTKSSGMPIVPLVVLMVAVQAVSADGRKLGGRFVSGLKVLGLWALAAAATYVAVWPGMWVAPAKMLGDVYGNALSYTFQGARLSVLPGLDARGFGLSGLGRGIAVYLNDLLWRMTPMTAVGLLLGIGLVVYLVRAKRSPNHTLLSLYAILLAAAFVVLFGIQRGPKPPHYILTAYACLDLVAALAFMLAWDISAARLRGLAARGLPAALMTVLLALQLGSSLGAYPYYISYYNPIIEALSPGIQNPTLNETGYGVGLDQAAAYLSRKTDAEDLVVLSAHGLGCFSYYFPGKTLAMNYLDMSDPTLVAAVRESDYVVVDYFNQTRRNTAMDLEAVTPELSIWINGHDFLRIYRASDLPARTP